MKRLLLLAAMMAGQAMAQAPCPAADDVESKMLLGEWKAELQGSWEIATLRLVKHPEYGDSFRGTLERTGSRAQVAGDLADGGFTLEESADGVRIAATWLGEVVDGSCGREIRGTWTRDGETAGRDFVLRKQ